MRKFKKITILVIVLQLIFWIGFAFYVFFAGTEAAGNAANQASQSGAESGGVVGAASAGFVVALFSELGVVFGTILVSIFAFNTLLVLIIYCLKDRPSIFGGILALLFSSIIVGILIIVDANKTKKIEG